MSALPVNRILHGDCVQVMRGLPSESVDFILTDPPYLVRYRDRSGRTVANDDNDRWLSPAFAEMYRLLKPGGLAVSFYGWNSVDRFFAAWRGAGFGIDGHVVFRKRYASAQRFFQHRHESAYLLTKGRAALPVSPLPDVLEWHYTGNRLHPTEKSPRSLAPLIGAFCPPGALVLDPFCSSGSSLVAAREAGCAWLGIELDAVHHRTASKRVGLADVAGDEKAPPPRPSQGATNGVRGPFTRYVHAA
jgi:DNA modification methylase